MLQGQIWNIYFFIRQNGMEQVNGLLVISGALDYLIKIAIKVGGYDIHTVGEDMEIIVRMRRYMEELEDKPKYKVAYIPDPLCWTEAPDNYKTFTSQRNRWTRGTIETRKHRKLVLIEIRRHGSLATHIGFV
jgi:cellulose synthase/poly-beta-1,6-N-acetylglucosamine synthase-like glycosyltransferase